MGRRSTSHLDAFLRYFFQKKLIRSFCSRAQISSVITHLSYYYRDDCPVVLFCVVSLIRANAGPILICCDTRSTPTLHTIDFCYHTERTEVFTCTRRVVCKRLTNHVLLQWNLIDCSTWLVHLPTSSSSSGNSHTHTHVMVGISVSKALQNW